MSRSDRINLHGNSLLSLKPQRPLVELLRRVRSAVIVYTTRGSRMFDEQ